MTEVLTKETFLSKVFNYEQHQEWQYNGELPAVIDFWAPWCGPCRFLSPIIDELSGEMKGQVRFYKVNTDEEQELASVFGIRSIPSLLFIPKEGKPMMSAGALPKNDLVKIINENLLNKKVITV
ncbi:MAG: thioredoxin [Bacteriovoracaceae bacterium]|nr:thioredoxin [Bacteroidota bacterium]